MRLDDHPGHRGTASSRRTARRNRAASLLALVVPLAIVVGGVGADEDVAAKVEARVRDAERYGGSSFHLADPIAALGAPAVAPLAAILADPTAPAARRVVAAQALGHVRTPAAVEALRAALLRSDLPEAVRLVAEAGCFLQGETGPTDARIAMLATKHRDMPVTAAGAHLRLARVYASTARFRIAADLMKQLVRSERAKRPHAADLLAYDWACYAALSGDKTQTLEAVELAIRSDRTDLDWMAKDLDLSLVREDERFRTLLDEAKRHRAAKRPPPADLSNVPGYGDLAALRDAWSAAFETWIESNNRYWGGYEGWLKKHGRERSPEASKAYQAEHGAEPTDPAAEWAPKFEAFVKAHRPGPLAQQARLRLVSIYGNQRKWTELVDTYLAALAEGPSLAAIAERADTALMAASQSKRFAEVRDALVKEASARPKAPETASILLALAETPRDEKDADARRTAYAEIVERFPGSDAATTAQGALRELTELREGAPAPDFSAKDVRGETWTLSALRGKVVLLDFWATWCGPCLGELPLLRSIWKEHADAAGRDFVMIGISLDEDGWELAELLEADPLGWPQICDLGGFESPIAKRYNVQGIPTSVLVDREGRILKKDLRDEELRDAVRTLLAPAK